MKLITILFEACVLLLLPILSMYIQVIIHEFGHLVMGKLTGYKFVSFRIFNILFTRENNKLKIKHFSLAGTGGQCLLEPPDDFNNTKYILYNLGGSLFNFVSSLFALLLSPIILINAFVLKSETLFVLLFAFLFWFIVLGISLALANIIPLTTSNFINDGYNILLINKNPKNKKAFYNILKINALHSKNIAYKDMPEKYFQIDTIKIDNSLLLSNATFNSYYIYDKTKDFLIYEKEIENILKNNTCKLNVLKYNLISELLFIKIIHNKPIDEINSLVNKKFLKYMKFLSRLMPSINRTMYAYELLINKNNERANLYLKKFNKLIKNYPFKNDIIKENEFISMVHNFSNI